MMTKLSEPDPALDIIITADIWQRHDPAIENFCQQQFEKILQKLPHHVEGQVVLVLGDDEMIQNLNQEFRGKDKPTNILSFPYHGAEGLLGEMILAYETIAKEAEDASKTFYDHLTHLILHGLLHLLGYDHEIAAAAEEMEALEIKILHDLSIQNPYDA